MPFIQVGRSSRLVRAAKTAAAVYSKVDMFSIPFLFQGSAKEERREGLRQGLLSFLFVRLYAPAPPADESIRADDHRPAARDSIRITEPVTGIDEISCITANLIDVQREMEGVFCVTGSGLPVPSIRANKQDEVGAEQVSRRDRLALSLEHEMR